MRDVRLLIKNGVILTSAIILAGGLSFTSFAAPEDATSGPGDGAATSEAIDSVNGTQDPTANPSMGYDVQEYGFNVYGFDSEGNQIRSTYANAGYGTYVDNTNSSSRVGGTDFEYGTPYTVNGLETTITPEYVGDNVTMNYDMRNVTEEDRTFRVGSNADTQIGRNDRATIVGDGTGVTMYDNEGTGIVLQPEPGQPAFDHLWYGYYGDRNENTFTDTGIQTGELSGVDSGVAWSWNVPIPAGQSAQRSVSFRIGENIFTPTSTPQYVGWGPGPEKAPDIWCALTDAGNALPIPAMGKASANTFTMFANISGCTYGQIREALKATYAAAPAGGAYVFGTTEVSVIDTEIAEALSSRSDVAISIVYSQKGQQFQVNIPAGTNFKSLLDENGYCGFLKLASQFGVTAIG